MSKYDDYNTKRDEFMEYELLPRIISDPTFGFPEFSFFSRGGNWLSKIHADDLQPRRHHTNPCTTLYVNSGQLVDPSRCVQDNIVWWKVRHYNKTLHETLEELAGKYNISDLLPVWESDEGSSYKQLQDAKTSLLRETTRLLWSTDPDAVEMLDYLRERGWTDEEIKTAQLGYINVATRTRSEYDIIFKWTSNGNTYEQRSAGTTHRLTIPYFSGGRLLGFKIRDIHFDPTNPKYEGKEKYKNTKGLSKSAGFYGIPIKTDRLVIVEGELDALHAQIRGFTSIAGTAGGGVLHEQVRDALRRGVTRFVLLFDNDERGASFVRPSIKVIEEIGGPEVEVRIATIPESEGKDLDDYLKTHTIDDLENLIQDSTLSCELKYNDIRDKYVGIRDTQGKDLTELQQQDYKNDVRQLLNDPHTQDWRERIYTAIKSNEKVLGFAVSDSYREFVDQLYYEDKARQRRQEVVSATQKVQEALNNHQVNKALDIMRRTAEEVKMSDKHEEYSKTLAPSSIAQMRRLAHNIKGVETGYIFTSGDGTKSVPLELNEGLTFINANTGHGKTSLLNNIAINVATRNLALGSNKSVLFFSYEVSKIQILAGLLNLYYNDPKISDDPQSAILSYLRGEGNKEFYNDPKLFMSERGYIPSDDEMVQKKSEEYDRFIKCVSSFDKILRRGGIIVAETSYSVEELVNSIKWYLRHSRPSIVCIDYVQLLYSETAGDKQRYDELKKIVNDIKTLANAEHIPFVLASQFNRQVESPLDLKNSNVGESGSIERVADTSIGLYNLKELHTLTGKDSGDNGELVKTLQGAGLSEVESKNDIKAMEGKIFARLMKRRYGYYPIDTILEWEGKTKYIKPNDPTYSNVEEEAINFLDSEPTYEDPNDPFVKFPDELPF